MTRYLTLAQVLFIHARLIEETGGSHGWRDLTLLQSALARPQATFGGEQLYPDLFSQAAALMHSLVQNHPFIDGNKRVGITAAALFLQQNGYQLTTPNPEMESFILAVASGQSSVAEIALWLETHSAPLIP